MTTANDVLSYIISHPLEEVKIFRMKYSGGVMELFDVGPYRVRWDLINTAAYRKHWHADNHGALRAHIIKYLTNRGHELYEGNIRTS